MTTSADFSAPIDPQAVPEYNRRTASQHGAHAFSGSPPIRTEQPFLSVIVPAYNEARRLPKTLSLILDYLRTQPYASEVIVVDDGSTDETIASVQEQIDHSPEARLIANPHFGKGYTVRTGMLAAQGTIALFTDADLSTPIEEVARLLPWFEQGYDVVIGSREGGGERQRIGEPFYRHLMGRVFNGLVQLMAVRGIRDTQCGFKAMRREVAQAVFPKLRLHTGEQGPIQGSMVTAFDVEMLFIASKLGYRIREVPVEWHYGTESKVHPLRDSYRNFRDVLMVRWNDLGGRYRF